MSHFLPRRSVPSCCVLHAAAWALLLLVTVPAAAATSLGAPAVTSASVVHEADAATIATAPHEDPARSRTVVPERGLPLPAFAEREGELVLADTPPTATGHAAHATAHVAHSEPRSAARHGALRPLHASRLHLYCVYRL